MCGLVGWIQAGKTSELATERASKMLGTISYRGPDSKGFAAGDGWAVGHARLAIIDPIGGAQPIFNGDKSILIVGNNEIYNAPELRRELEEKGYLFKSNSDTEVILHAWEEWGIDSFPRLNGMYAVTVIDKRQKKCILARDPMGIKPLHWIRFGNGFAFASEIKGLLAIPEVNSKPNLDSFHLFMNLRYVPGNQTLFSGVERLAPGHSMIFEWESGNLQLKSFFDWRKAQMNSSRLNYAESSEELSTLLKQSVARHLISDVEVASFLSGGIDSSLVSALASKRIPNLQTFCMAFGEPTDETLDAQKVSIALGTRHQSLNLSGNALDRYSEAIWHTEEPKVNCIQGFILDEAVSKRGIKVALSGLGGDELFAGYTNNDVLYPMTCFSRALGTEKGTHNLSGLQSILKRGDFFFRGTELLKNYRNPLQFYAILRNAFDHSPYLMNSIYKRPRESWRNLTTASLAPYFESDNPDILNALLVLEMRTKLTNDFLLTEDRVSMAHGLEVRVPLLDQKLIDFALKIPSHFKYRPGYKKLLLKSVAQQWIPQQSISKRKSGFSFNPHLLFQTELGSVARKILTREKVEEMGLFSWKWIERVMEAPPSPRLRWHYFNLWMMTGTVLWHDRFFGEGK